MGIYLLIIFKENYCASKTVVWLINKSEYNAHTTKHFKTLKSIHELETAKFMFDCVHNTLTKPLKP